MEPYARLFGLPLNLYASEYSTGMRKKLVAVALFLQYNELYLLDEPFNGLDLSAVISMKRIIENLRAAGATFLISSHIISILADSCNPIHFLKNGTIAQTFSNVSAQQIEATLIATEMTEENDLIQQLL